MKNILTICILLLLNCLNSNAQLKANTGKLKINKIELYNDDLLLPIKEVIQKMNSKSELFKSGFGYLVVTNIKFHNYSTMNSQIPNSGTWKDTLTTFELSVQNHFLGSDEVDCFYCDYYPNLYTYVENRLVLLYYEEFDWATIRPSKSMVISNSIYKQKSIRNISIEVKKSLKAVENEDFVFTKFITKEPYKLNKNSRRKMKKYQIYSTPRADFYYSWQVVIHRDGSKSLKQLF